MLARMTSCASAFVYPIQQDISARAEAGDQNENEPPPGSPRCSSRADRSIESRRTRAGVPVLSLPTEKPIRLRDSPKPSAASSPSRPQGALYSPMKIFPSMKVPVVRTTVLADIEWPRAVFTPATRFPSASRMKSTTVSMKTDKPPCRSTASRAAPP
jgi:hypothetical protein